MNDFRCKSPKFPIAGFLLSLIWLFLVIPYGNIYILTPIVFCIFNITNFILNLCLSLIFSFEFNMYMLSERQALIEQVSFNETVVVYCILLTIIAFEFYIQINRKYKTEAKNE